MEAGALDIFFSELGESTSEANSNSGRGRRTGFFSFLCVGKSTMRPLSLCLFLCRREHKATPSLMGEAGALEDDEQEDNNIFRIIQTKYTITLPPTVERIKERKRKITNDFPQQFGTGVEFIIYIC